MVRYRTLVPFALATFIVTWGASGSADDSKQDDGSKQNDGSKEDDGSKTVIGADFDLAFPIKSSGNTGGGFGIRLGQQWHFPFIALTPEIGFTYHGFSGDLGPKSYRGIVGARLGIGEIIRIGPYAHAGYASLSPAVGSSDGGFTYDVGGFLDLTLIPLIDIGVHGGYNHLSVDDRGGGSYAFGTVGLDVALKF